MEPQASHVENGKFSVCIVLPCRITEINNKSQGLLVFNMSVLLSHNLKDYCKNTGGNWESLQWRKEMLAVYG